jgi:hypothetical protein
VPKGLRFWVQRLHQRLHHQHIGTSALLPMS